MIRTLFEKQRKLLDHFFEMIDISSVEQVFEKLRSASGSVILSGIGKSGHIAQKISSTLLSTGTKSSFLCPANALHGDLGVISAGDVCLFLSKSGESQELIDLLPYVQKKGAFTIAVVSQMESRLAKLADMALRLPVQKELCTFDLAPTISTAAQLLFGDCLAIALMQAKAFSVKDFAFNHPSGFLGRKITLKVSDLMLRGEALPLCKPTDRLMDVLHELSAKKCGCVLICNEYLQLEGIFTDGDLRRGIQSQGADVLQKPLSMLMTRFPLTTSPNLLVFDAMRQMESDASRLVTTLPVTENGILMGLLRMHDVLQIGLR
jgi:arabinose-5-phosphate isomerase